MRFLSVALCCLPVLALSALSSCPSEAAEWHREISSARSGSAGEVADAYLAEQTQTLQLADVSLTRVNVLRVGNYSTVRYRQTYAGLPVLDSAAAVHVAPDGRVVAAVLELARGLTLGSSPSLDAELARAAAAAQHGLSAAQARSAELAVLRGARGDKARLVWTVVVPTRDGGYRHVLDAHSGQLLEQRALARHALGRVYPISSVVTPMTQDVELIDLVVSDPQLLNGWNGNLTVANYDSGSAQNNVIASQTLVPNVGQDFLYDPPAIQTDATDGFAQVGIYYHLTRYRDYFSSTHGLDFSPASWKLTAVANFGENGSPLDNAFYSQQGIGGSVASPNLIGIGQGSSFDFSDDSDVFLHEMTHYVSQNAVGYSNGQVGATSFGLSPFGGSIDEGISDYFACTINDDPILGEASLAFLSSARDLTDTTKRCSDDMVAEVHADGEIIGSFSWSLRSALGKEIGDQLVWGATTLLTPNPSFGDYARGVQQTAADLLMQDLISQADVDAIDALIAERGLQECDEEVPLRVNEPRKGTLFGLDVVGQLIGTNCTGAKMFGVQLQSLFHYQVTPSADAKGITVSANLSPFGSGELNWGLYARANQHVTFSSQGFLPEVDEFDYSALGNSSTNGILTIDENSDPPFDPAASYHVVLVHQNCPLAEMALSLTELSDSSGAGGAGGAGVGGAGAGGDDVVVIDNGCGCKLAGPSDQGKGGSTALLLLAAGLGLLQRRRRHGHRKPD